MKISRLLHSEIDEYIKFRKLASLESAWVNTTTIEKLETIDKIKKFKIFLAKSNTGAILGTAIFELKEDCLKISLISVLQIARKKGVGKALMQFAEKVAVGHAKQKIQLNVNSTNTEAIRFYQSMGYEQCGNSWLRTFTKSI